MNTNWKEMSKQEKVLFFAYVIIGAIGFAFAVADMYGGRKNADLGWLVCVVVVVAMECAQNWKENRKRAIVEIVGGVIVVIACLGNKLL